MASRPVFVPTETPPFTSAPVVEFTWFPGHTAAQKQRSVAALHERARSALDLEDIIEISTKSLDPIGVRLSAFLLNIQSEVLELTMTVESAFQGSKVFGGSGQHEELYKIQDGREVKRRIASWADEPVVGFRFEGRDWPTEPQTAFYDWIYLRALRQKIRAEELSDGDSETEQRLLRADGFTDIEFNPSRSINCQARSVALFVALQRLDLLDQAEDPPTFLDLIGPGEELAAGPPVTLSLFED